MASLNKVFIIGNLGKDPEIIQTNSGQITKITVATSEKWTDKQTGEKKERTEWTRIIFFGKQAETVGRYMSKGSQIYVEGKLQTSQYEKDGITRYSTDIIANNFQFIGKKSDSMPQAQGQSNGQQSQGGQYQPQPINQYPQNQQGWGQGTKDDDDIPF